MQSLSSALRQVSVVLAVVAALVLTAVPRADAGIVQITDFGGIACFSPQQNWLWTAATAPTPGGQLDVLFPTESSDYLFEQLYRNPTLNIAGMTTLSLTGHWFPYLGSPNGDFYVRLSFEGTTRGGALFSFNDFASGGTVTKPLTLESKPFGQTDAWYRIDQVYIDGIASSAVGSLTLTNLSASSNAVPEIDPASMSGALAMLGGALGLLERRRLRVSIS